MATNRYTNLTPSTFNPLSLQEIMMVPLAKQGKHDAAMQTLASEGEFDVNRLAVDDPYIKESINKFRGELTGVEDDLMSRGVNSGISKKLIDLKRRKQQNLSQDGDWGKAQNAYNAYVANVQEINKNKNLSGDQKRAGIQWALNNYEGVKEGGAYNPYQGSDYVNIQEKALEYAEKMSPQEIEQLLGQDGWERRNDGTWRNDKLGTETLTADHITKAIIPTLLNDDSVRNYLTDAQRIGLIKDPMSAITNAASNSGILKQVSNKFQSQDMKFQPGYFTDGTGNPTTNPTSYEVYKHPATNTTWADTLIEKYDNYKNVNGTFDGIVKSLEGDDSFRHYMETANSLAKQGIIKQPNFANRETLDEVMNIVKGLGNYKYNTTIKNGDTTKFGNISGINTKSNSAVLKHLQNNKGFRHYMDPSDGNIETWETLDAQGDVEIEAYQGWVDSDNGLVAKAKGSAQHNDKASEFASPYSVTVKITDDDGNVTRKQMFMSRSAEEINSKAYQNELKLNDIFSRSKSKPLQPVSVGDEKITFIPAEAYGLYDKYNGVPIEGTAGYNAEEAAEIYNRFAKIQKYIKDPKSAKEGEGFYLYEYEEDGETKSFFTTKSFIANNF